MTQVIERRVLAVLITMASVGNAFAASPEQAPPTALSQIDVSVRIARDLLQNQLRAGLAASVAEKTRQTVEEVDIKALGLNLGKVEAVVDSTPRPSLASIAVNAAGGVEVWIPVDIDARVGTRGVVESVGCGRKRFVLSVTFARVESAQRLEFTRESVTADSGGFRCLVRAKPVADFLGRVVAPKRPREKNVAEQVRRSVESMGRDKLAGVEAQLGRLLRFEAQFKEMAARPVSFGSVDLELEVHRFTAERIHQDGEDIRLDGFVEGYPRLNFGDRSTADSDRVEGAVSEAGFRLPAVLLFPTDAALVPEAKSVLVETGPGFGLQRVPGRADLAVLQRRGAAGVEDVIWLSGGARVPQRARSFDQPVDAVLDEILAWLDDPKLWGGVPGAVELQQEVRGFQSLVEQFRQDTRLGLGERGELSFRQLELDLLRVWVTGEAIWAQVTLRGEATLDLRLAL